MTKRKASGGCPHSRKPAAAPAQATLQSASEVETSGEDPALAAVLRWVRGFLAQVHPQAGRAGPVCPFVPQSLELDTIWLTTVPLPRPDRHDVLELVRFYRDVFLNLEPRTGEAAMNKAILIVFPSMKPEHAPTLIDDVQSELKPSFVEAGLMLGEFHQENESPGLRNPEFRPFRSPVPMLAIRHMVESDLPFLKRDEDPPGRRALFIRAYLRRLGGAISGRSFEAAIQALVDAELMQRTAAEAPAGERLAP